MLNLPSYDAKKSAKENAIITFKEAGIKQPEKVIKLMHSQLAQSDIDEAKEELKVLRYYNEKYIYNPYLMQSLTKLAEDDILPYPSQTCVYTKKEDFIGAISDFKNGLSDPETMTTRMILSSKINGLGIWVKDQDTLKRITKNILKKVRYTKEEKNIMTVLNLLKEKPFDMFFFKQRESMNILLQELYREAKMSNDFGIIPSSLEKMFYFTTLYIVDISSNDIDQSDINQAEKLSNTYIELNKEKIMSLQSINRIKEEEKIKLQARSITPNKFYKTDDKFLKNYLEKEKINKEALKRQIDKQKAYGKNSKKMAKSSYLIANRRNPDDINKKGTYISNSFAPDVHIYLDASGSMSMERYTSAINQITSLAHDLNLNMYITSFSNYIGPTHFIKKGSSKRKIKKILGSIKTTGGTDYEQVYNYINDSKIRRNRINILLTDFEYILKNPIHPKNLFYSKCKGVDQTQLKRFMMSAEDKGIDIKLI